MFNRFKKRNQTSVSPLGFFDGVVGDSLNGWLYAGPNVYVQYQIFCDDVLIHEGVASQFREDLKSIDLKSDFSFRVSMDEIDLFSKIKLKPNYTFRVESELGDAVVNQSLNISVFSIFNKGVLLTSKSAFEKLKQFVKHSHLFDTQFYRERYKDISKSGSDPLSHYLLYGTDEERWPNKYFDSGLYAKKYQTEHVETNHLFHYLFADKKLINTFSEEFEHKWAEKNKLFKENKKKATSFSGPLGHFDGIEKTFLTGWLYSGKQDNLDFKIFCDNKLIYEGVANQYREDLKNIDSRSDFAFRVSLNEIGFFSSLVLKPSYRFRIESSLGEVLTNHTLRISVFSIFNKEVLTTSKPAFELVKKYISKSLLFDQGFYLNRYKDIARKNSDPLSHFLLYGAIEGRWPNRYFDSALFNRKYQAGFSDVNPLFFYLFSDNALFDELSSEFDVKLYLAVNKDVKDAGIDPLLHFITDGKNEGRISHVAQFSSNCDNFDNNTVQFIPSISKLRTTVILPVFNAYEEVESCLNSLLKYTDLAANSILVLDDASTDPRMLDLLNSYRNISGVTIRFNEKNIGYTRNINQGVDLSKSDIVLLNSDTEVGPHWLRNLKIAAYSNSEIGTVTAVSNNAGAFSVPNSGTNEVPQGFTTEKMARLVSRSGCNRLIEVPTGNGFCFYVKRETLDSVGHFDEQLFPRGYGEENEFCMRVLRSGKINVVSPNTYVYHVRSASFKEEKTELITSGVNKVKELYPDYSSLIKGIGSSELFNVSRQTIAERLNTYTPSQPLLLPRVMFVISTRTGGTPQTNLDLMRGVASFYDCYVLACNTHQIEIMIADDSGYSVVETFPLCDTIKFASHKSSEYDEIVRSILVRYDIDLLHIRHLAWHSLNLPKLAKDLEIPVVNSFHDFYTICPSVNLIDSNGVYQAHGVVANGFNPLWKDKTVLSNAWGQKDLDLWRTKMSEALIYSDVFVTTCQSAKDVIVDALPELIEADNIFEVIPHGRDFSQFVPSTTKPNELEPLRVLLPGNISISKGAALIRDIKVLDILGQIEFHVLGACDDSLVGVVIQHGRYERSEFTEKVQTINPHIGAVFSIWPETYCHTLTECWVAGLPVIGVEYGAVKERLEKTGAGWLCSNSAEDIYQQLLDIKSLNDWEEKVENIKSWQEGEGSNNTVQRMSLHYVSIYKNLLNKSEEKHRQVLSNQNSLTGFIMKGSFPDVVPTAYVRMIDWTSWFEEEYQTKVEYITWYEFISTVQSKYDRIVVQRDSIPQKFAGPILDLIKKYDIELVFEIDDDLMNVPAEIDVDNAYAEYRDTLKLIMQSADQMYVTNEQLRETLSTYNSNIILRPNKVSRERWLRKESTEFTSLELQESDLNILYFGSKTHQRDLEFLVKAVSKARDAGKNIHLYIIGIGEHQLVGSDFVHRLSPPSSRYDLFVDWLVTISNNFDLGVCPLMDTEFSKNKSYIKCIENLALGLPVLCSDNKPYSELKDTSLEASIVFLENQLDIWSDFFVKFKCGKKVTPNLDEYSI